MKSNRTLLKILALVWMTGFFFSSCTKEEIKLAAPTIELVHVGSHDMHDESIFYLGEEGHFEVNILAPAGIDKIDLEIRQISGYATFSLTKTYQEGYTGKKELSAFQDYPLIPVGEGIGNYNFQLKVTDLKGQITTVEKEVTVELREGEPVEHQH